MDNTKESKTTDTSYNSDVTKEDLKVLGLDQPNLRNDGGDDQMLKDRESKVDFSGSDLDVPGRNMAKPTMNEGNLKDEENELYSQGGESNENLETIQR